MVPETMEIIDCHQHYWALARNDYSWLTPDRGVLYADFTPADLAPSLRRCGIDRTVVIQAAPTLTETYYLLGLAHKNDSIAAVVGWADLESTTIARDIAALAAFPKLKGIRPMIQDIADPSWIAKPNLSPAFTAIIDHNLVFDALIRPQHLVSLMNVMERHPELPMVINHAAKPPDRQVGTLVFKLWQQHIAKISEHTNVWCKFSGLVTKINSIEDIRPVFEHIYECFGADRIMWGSDWPVVKLCMQYEEWLSMAKTLLAELPIVEQQKILCTNAQEFYNL